ncbi:MAG: hypothetical protein JSW50_05665 [Candidatus Latescibacterota bacterium]|nr:MAG: hypothetical protein JSW50_05665 [Candidatus Latescibacterota bacterium]
MTFDLAKLINLVLAVAALSLYIIGSRRFYLDRRPFLRFLVAAIMVDGLTAALASSGVTPTTKLPYSDFVPWQSKLFVTHVILASIGFFGFVGVTTAVAIKGVHRSYPRLRVVQYRWLLPIWLVGEGIALVTSMGKIFFRVRLYDYL